MLVHCGVGVRECMCVLCACVHSLYPHFNFVHQVVQDVQYVCEPQHEQTVESVYKTTQKTTGRRPLKICRWFILRRCFTIVK